MSITRIAFHFYLSIERCKFASCALAATSAQTRHMHAHDLPLQSHKFRINVITQRPPAYRIANTKIIEHTHSKFNNAKISSCLMISRLVRACARAWCDPKRMHPPASDNHALHHTIQYIYNGNQWASSNLTSAFISIWFLWACACDAW